MLQENPGKRASKSRFEFLAMLTVLALAGFGGHRCIAPILASNHNENGNSSILGQQLLQNEHFSLDSHAPNRSVPERYRIQGTVDERYTVAEDPHTGETIIQDSIGSIGGNSTSIEGDRALLAKNMVDLQQYIDENRDSLPADAYNWLRKVARSGIELAFGTPGYPTDAQGALKTKLLEDFHAISSNPPASVLQTDKYLSLEGVFSPTETAYQNPGQNNTNFLKADAISSPDKSWNPQYYDNFTNQTLSTIYTPPLNTLANSPASPYTYADTSNTGIQSPSSSISSASPGNQISVADYYQTTLGTNGGSSAAENTSTSTAASSNGLDTSQVLGTVITIVTKNVYTNGTLTSSTSTTTTSQVVLSED